MHLFQFIYFIFAPCKHTFDPLCFVFKSYMNGVSAKVVLYSSYCRCFSVFNNGNNGHPVLTLYVSGMSI